MFYKNVEEFKNANGYDYEGTWYPRVTSILSIKSKPALYYFYASQPSFAAAEKVKQQSADEGTLLHETVEALLAGKEVAIPATIRPAVEAFLRFKNENTIIPHLIEEKLISKKHSYVGTLDVLAEVNGQLGVLDIKTSYAIYRDYNLQAAAYAEALKELPEWRTTPLTRWILRLDQSKSCLHGCGATMREKGGNTKIRNSYTRCPHQWGEIVGDLEFKELHKLEKDVRAFLSAKTLWEWEHEPFISQIQPASPTLF